jgi:hypothetical protein
MSENSTIYIDSLFLMRYCRMLLSEDSVRTAAVSLLDHVLDIQSLCLTDKYNPMCIQVKETDSDKIRWYVNSKEIDHFLKRKEKYFRKNSRASDRMQTAEAFKKLYDAVQKIKAKKKFSTPVEFEELDEYVHGGLRWVTKNN